MNRNYFWFGFLLLLLVVLISGAGLTNLNLNPDFNVDPFGIFWLFVLTFLGSMFIISSLFEPEPMIDVSIDAQLERLRRNINVQAVSITDFQFSAIFNDAIEAKVTQEQASLTAQNKLAQIQFEAQQRVAQAEGEATAIKIQGAAIQSLGGKDYIQLQAIQKWNGQLPLVTGGSSLPFINIPTTNTTQ